MRFISIAFASAVMLAASAEVDACAFAEEVILPLGANGQPAGYRRLLRFDTLVMNAGDGDLVTIVP